MSVRLERSVRGRGANLTLLHGWGLNSAVWKDIATALAGGRKVTSMDLPGHGYSPMVEPGLDAWAQACLDSAPPRSAWLGWSLGGMVAMRAAQLQPHRITRLVLVCTTPRFVSGEGWAHGLDPTVVRGFAADLATDHAATVNRFLSLQVQGDEAARTTLRELRAFIADRPPAPAALDEGFSILEQADLRASLDQVQQPTLVMVGDRDRLTPASAGRWLAEHLPEAELHSFRGAAHAPFLSHRDAFLQRVRDHLGVAV